MIPQQKAAEQANERPWEVLGITEAQWDERQDKLSAITTGPEPAAIEDTRKRKPRADKGQPRKKPEPAPAPLTVGIAAGLTEAQRTRLFILLEDVVLAYRAVWEAETSRIKANIAYNDYLDSLTAHTE